jgi:hypothetical protein
VEWCKGMHKADTKIVKRKMTYPPPISLEMELNLVGKWSIDSQFMATKRYRMVKFYLKYQVLTSSRRVKMQEIKRSRYQDSRVLRQGKTRLLHGVIFSHDTPNSLKTKTRIWYENQDIWNKTQVNQQCFKEWDAAIMSQNRVGVHSYHTSKVQAG